MQAWQLTAHGSPEKVLRPCERPDPAPKPGQVLIRSEGFGLPCGPVGPCAMLDPGRVRGTVREGGVHGLHGRTTLPASDAPPAPVARSK